MSPAAPAMKRRSLLQYAIGLDLVVIVVGIGLLIPPQNWALILLFIAAVGVAAWRGGWKVGLATTAFSMLALAIVFGDVVPQSQRLLFSVLGTAASVVAGRRKRPALPAPKPPSEELETLRAAELSRQRRQRLLPLVMYAGLPLLVLVIYTNISDVLIRNFPVPSLLQPLILLLAIPVLRYRDAFRPESAVLHPLTIALIGYCLFVFASSNWARDVTVSDKELIDLMKSLVILILVASLAASWRALRIALAALVAGALFLAAISLIQVALGDPDLQFGGLASLERGHLFGELEELRPSGPVGDPNYFARILIIALPFAAFLGVGIRNRFARAGLIAAAAVIGLAILFTYSRGAMLAVAAMALMLLLVRRIRLTWVTVLIGLIALAALIPTTIGQRILTMQALVLEDTDMTALDSSLDKRRVLLAAGWRLFTDHPFLGVGAGNFGAHYPAYSNLIGWTGHDYTPLGVRQYAHNLYLEMAAETGLVGLLAFGLAMALALGMLVRSRRALLARGDPANAALVTAIAIALAGYLISSLFLHSGYHRYLWLLLGFALAAIRLTNDARRSDEA